jgi:hypothetical protein
MRDAGAAKHFAALLGASTVTDAVKSSVLEVLKSVMASTRACARGGVRRVCAPVCVREGVRACVCARV